MSRLDGRVAFTTGIAGGQGRAHAIRFAQEGADIIGIDALTDIGTVGYPMATQDDMDQTCGRSRRWTGASWSARSTSGTAPPSSRRWNVPVEEYPAQAFRDVVDVDLTSVFLNAKAAISHIKRTGEGGAPWIQPEDVAEAALYLAADSGRYVTGGTHRVDAGWNTK